MAKAGAGKQKMKAVRDKRQRQTRQSLKRTFRSFSGGKRRKKNGCYVATCVYGSYDCPEVWVLRRYRDNVLEKTIIGRLFVSTYYFISPSVVNLWGNNRTVRNVWKKALDHMVIYLKNKGFKDNPYKD